MCEPATIMTVAALSGTAISAYGAYQQGQNARKVAEYNATVNEFQAKDALERGGIESDRQRARTRQIKGAQIAAMGGSGATVGEGTLGDVLDQTATMGELDARTIETNALREAWGLKSQAGLGRAQGEAAAQAGMLQGFGTLIAGGAQAYGVYDKWKAPKKTQ